jgi:hypothetical protein
MNYLKLSVGSDDPKVTGRHNGSCQAFFSDEFWNNNSQLYEYMWGSGILEFRKGIPPNDFELNLLNFELHKSSKKSDFIWIGAFSTGYVISEKLRKLLQNFVLPPHKYYTITFKQWNKKGSQWKIINGYSWLFFGNETGEYNVDFRKSTFDFTYHVKNLNVIESEIKIESYKDYMDFILKTQRSPDCTKIFFNRNFNKDLDLWSCNFLSGENYISEKLLNSLIENKITGYRTYT